MHDQRDPKELGEQILHKGLKASVQRHHGTISVSLSQVYDYAAKRGVLDEVPLYDPGASTVVETISAYRAEMVSLAEEGDVHARDVCNERAWAYEIPQEDSRDESEAQTQVLRPDNGWVMPVQTRPRAPERWEGM